MNGLEKIEITDSYIKILNKKTSNIVMHVDERIIQKEKKLAEIVTQNGGDILEIGFGLHISSDFIQSKSNITSHTIIEIHPVIYRSAIEWGKNKKNVNILLGDWMELVPLNNLKFDGIIHDTHIDNNISFFLDKIKENCKVGTIVGLMKHPNDGRLNAVKSDEYNFEFKYTTFDGFNFYKEKTSKKLL